MKKVVLVTGASSGIGLDTCYKFLEKGFIVYGAARRLENMQEFAEKGGHAVYMDLTDKKSVDLCINRIKLEQGRVDILVNNAGYAAGGSLEEIPIDEARCQFDVNVFGLMLVIQKVLPLMREQGEGRIINVSSIAGRFSSPFLGWYHASKYSVEALSSSLRMEVASFGIKVILIEPGFIRTSWGVIAADSISKCCTGGPYEKSAAGSIEFYKKNYCGKGRISSPSVVSSCIVKASCKKHPGLRYNPGKYSKILVLITRFMPLRVFDFLCKIFFHV
ncbi:oxidoreductase [Treponema sp.]|uniref:oxidoreductase n=1 Tax=Treponema sp. TaxID=166 RepID=UPI0025D1749C|nr:oxidoreductase [Treponema sp.]